MNLKFKKIGFRNFWTFGNALQEFTFAENGLYNIIGKNKDKSGEDDRNRNGVGKSTLMQILHYALYGDSIGSQITLSGLVNNINRKNLEVYLDFSINDVDYRIERGRKPEYMHFFKQGNEYVDESLGDSRDTQEVIEKLIGISSDLFCQTVLLTCQVPVYMKQKLDVKRSIMEQVLGISALSEKVVKLKALIKNQKQDIENARFEYDAQIRANDTLRTTLNNQYDLVSQQMEEWEENKQKKIEQSKAIIETISKYDLDKEEQKIVLYEKYNQDKAKNDEIDISIRGLENNIALLSDEIKKNEASMLALINIDLEKEKEAFLFNEEVDKKEKEAMTIKLENAKTQQEENNASLKLKNLETELNNLQIQNESLKKAACPYCGAPLKNAQEMLEQNEEEIRAKKQEVIEAKALIECFKDRYVKLPKIPEKKQTTYPTMEALLSAFNMIDKIKTDNKNKEDLIKEKKDSIEELKLKKIELKEVELPLIKSLNEIASLKASLEQNKAILEELSKETENPFKKQINQLMEQLNAIQDVPMNNLTEMELELEHQEMLLKLLNDPKSSLRQAILTKSLAFLNQKVTDYLIKLNSEIYVQFNADMSVSMYKNGLELGSVSSGEEGRISLALQFAFRDAWECLNGIHPNLLLIDEVLDRSGLDEAGVEAAVDCLLELKDRTRYIVSHNKTITEKISNSIVVEKEGSFSKIIQ